MNTLQEKIKQQREKKQKIENLKNCTDLFELHFVDGSRLRSKQISPTRINYYFKSNTIAEKISNLINSKDTKYHCYFANTLPSIMPELCTKYIDLAEKNSKKLEKLLTN